MAQSLQIGSKGQDVAAFQVGLVTLGLLEKATGIFDQQTVKAVRRFQRDNSMAIDGVVTPNVVDVILDQAKNVVAPSKTTHPEQTEDGKLPTRTNLVPPGRPFLKGGANILHGLTVMVVAHTTQMSDILRCLVSVERVFDGYIWNCLVVAESWMVEEIESHPTSAFQRVVLPAPKNRTEAWNLGFSYVREKVDLARWPFVLPVDSRDEIDSGHIERLLPVIAFNQATGAFGDWVEETPTGHAIEHPATLTSVVMERVRVGAVIFNAKLIPEPPNVVFHSWLEANADRPLWLSWHMAGLRLEPVSGKPVLRRHARNAEYERSDWNDWITVRTHLHERNHHRPKVSALMITGKCVERYPLARVSVRCFLEQTWPNKELIIINHGPEKVWPEKDPSIAEYQIEREHLTLGDLRNMSIDRATGKYCVCWDDDDWSHPTRIETQMEKAADDTLVTFLWQVRCNMATAAAFYDQMPGGQHMSILFPRSTKVRYLPLNSGEDTEFLKTFGAAKKVVAIDNNILNIEADPLQYVRFYHGWNVWDEEHVMKGSLIQNTWPITGMDRLTPYHRDRLSAILKSYTNEPGFFLK